MFFFSVIGAIQMRYDDDDDGFTLTNCLLNKSLSCGTYLPSQTALCTCFRVLYTVTLRYWLNPSLNNLSVLFITNAHTASSSEVTPPTW